MNLDRRKFLIGVFGTVVVAAAGVIPEAIEKLPEKDFIRAVEAAMPRWDEVYGNGIDYAFAKIEYLSKPPYFKIIVPEGYYSLREESDRISSKAIAKMFRES